MRVKSIVTLCFAVGILSGTQVQADVQSWEYDQYTDDKGSEVYDFQEVELKIPKSWNGKYGFKIFDDRIDFYHKASRKAAREAGWGEGGRLFSLCFSEDTEFEEYLPAYEIIGDGEDGTYYLEFPTDVQGYPEDDRICGEWMDMTEKLEWITYYAVMKDYAGNVIGSVSRGDYIIPDSDVRYLEKGDLVRMNTGEMQMAINEIYARHGRMFQMREIRDYFESKSWYRGTIRAEKFDEALFNKYEDANVSLLLECMENPPVGVNLEPVEEYGVEAELEAYY